MFIKIVFLLDCILGVGIGVLRYFQITSNIDQSTGFFLQTDWSVWMLWIGIAVMILLPIIAVLFRKKSSARASRANLRFRCV